MRRVLQSKPIQVALIGASVLLAAVLLRSHDPELLQRGRDLTFDNYQRLRPRAPPQLPVRIVDIDDESVRLYGQWPWPRAKLAEIVDRLTQLGAVTVAFDMVFSEADRGNPAEIVERILQHRGNLDKGLRAALAGLPDSDEVFARSLSQVPSVVGFFGTTTANSVRPRQTAGMAIAGDDPRLALLRMSGSIVSLPQLQEAASGNGSISLGRDRQDDVIRRVPLLITDGTAIYPALSIEALRCRHGCFVLHPEVTGSERGDQRWKDGIG